VKSDASVLHMDSTEAFDIVTSQNVNLLVESSNENVEQLADFNLSLEKDIILCKSTCTNHCRNALKILNDVQL